MNSEVIKKEDSKVTLKIVVEAAQFDEAVNQAYNKMKSKFNIQGFRKGKAPRKIVERHYGVEVFYEEAFNIAFGPAYEAALDAHNIDPVDRPQIDIEEMKQGEAVVFIAEVEVMPEFEVAGYKGIEVEKKEYNVEDTDIQRELDALLEKNARMIAVEDRAVKAGDMVIIDYKGMLDGVAFDGGTAERHNLEIGSGQFIPGFEEQLIGKNAGEEVEVNVTFPEEYHEEDLAGKAVIFEVKIHEIKEKEVPALDDEFAKDVSEFDTLEELKNDIKTHLEADAKNKEVQDLRNSVIEAVSSKVEIVVPKAVVERQIDNMLMDFDFRLQNQGLNLEYYYQITGTKEDDLREQMRVDAAQTVKNELVLEKVGKAEGIVATDEDLEGQLEKMATQYKQEVEQLKSNLRQQDLDSIKDGIVIRKTIDFLVESAKVL